MNEQNINIKWCEITNEKIETFKNIYVGLDFGRFHFNTLVLVLNIDIKNKNIHIFDELVGKFDFKLLKLELISKDLHKLRIIADCSEPKLINFLRENNMFCIADNKYKTLSIKRNLNKFNIFIDKERCKKTYNHCIDDFIFTICYALNCEYEKFEFKEV